MAVTISREQLRQIVNEEVQKLQEGREPVRLDDLDIVVTRAEDLLKRIRDNVQAYRGQEDRVDELFDAVEDLLAKVGHYVAQAAKADVRRAAETEKRTNASHAARAKKRR